MQHLKLTGNKIGNMGGMALAGMLQINTSLVSLDVSDTDQVSEKIDIFFGLVILLNNVVKMLTLVLLGPNIYGFKQISSQIICH